jgi:hypothetical protein
LTTPTELKVWADPYVEGQDREQAEINQPGVRLRWGQMFKTGLEITAQYRRYKHDREESGNWLVGEGRLIPALQPLLVRDGTVWRAQAAYRIKVAKRHVFEPFIRYTNWDLDGAAMAHAGPSLQLTYLYISPRLVLDAIVHYHTHEAEAIHPAYGKTIEADRYGLGFTAFYDLFKRERWRAVASIDSFREVANVDFFDTKVNTFYLGAVWRHKRR